MRLAPIDEGLAMGGQLRQKEEPGTVEPTPFFRGELVLKSVTKATNSHPRGGGEGGLG